MKHLPDNDHSDDYGRLYRYIKEGEWMDVTDGSGLLVVRFRLLTFKGPKAQVEATARRSYGLIHGFESRS
jgi:hypothetical protein